MWESAKKKGTEFNDPKYAMAFTLVAMSDDKDDPNPEEGSEKRYISHAPDYRSVEVSTHLSYEYLPRADIILRHKHCMTMWIHC